MKYLTNYKRLFIITLFGSAMMGPLLTSCGSSGGDTTAGIGGTGITQGKITGFGSIFVNGIEFETGQSQFEVDGDTTLNEGDLRIGMVVRITGDVGSDGLTGDAENVEYDDDIQGPISSITAAVDGRRTLTIFDKTISIDDTTTSYENTDFDSIKINDIVEVSGFQTSATELDATYVKMTGVFAVGEDVELKGTISDLNSNSFKFGSITITYNIDTEIEDGLTLDDTLFVEVEGELLSATSILAKEIEAENKDDFEDGDEISLQGVINNLQGDLFVINGQQVDASNAEFSPDNAVLANGLNVEVEGNIVEGVLIAEEIELREGEAKLQAFVFSVDLNTNQIVFTFQSSNGTIPITTDNQTEFEDETGSSGTFSLDQVMPSDFIKIEGIDTGSQIIASQVKRLNPAGEDEEVQGEVEFFTGTTSIDSITLFGITFDVDDVVTPSGLEIGDIVEIKDENPADGLIDEIELED